VKGFSVKRICTKKKHKHMSERVTSVEFERNEKLTQELGAIRAFRYNSEIYLLPLGLPLAHRVLSKPRDFDTSAVAGCIPVPASFLLRYCRNTGH
jgi:hypothetical protein